MEAERGCNATYHFSAHNDTFMLLSRKNNEGFLEIVSYGFLVHHLVTMAMARSTHRVYYLSRIRPAEADLSFLCKTN